MAVPGQVERPELIATQEVSFRSEGDRIAAYLAAAAPERALSGRNSLTRHFRRQRSCPRCGAANPDPVDTPGAGDASRIATSGS